MLSAGSAPHCKYGTCPPGSRPIGLNSHQNWLVDNVIEIGKQLIHFLILNRTSVGKGKSLYYSYHMEAGGRGGSLWSRGCTFGKEKNERYVTENTHFSGSVTSSVHSSHFQDPVVDYVEGSWVVFSLFLSFGLSCKPWLQCARTWQP